MSSPESTKEPEAAIEGAEERLREEVKEYKDKYLRQLAEMENMRKRLQKEKQELTDYAVSNLLAEFLSPIDHMETALKHTENMSDEVKHWGLGFKMILTQFKDVLALNGVEAMQSQGKPFDPHLHEAIETVETQEYQPGTIVEECVKGYKMKDKVIRPARVKVAKQPCAPCDLEPKDLGPNQQPPQNEIKE